MKERIELATSVIQAFAVVIGIGFAINEFVLKDRDAQRGQIKLTVDLVDRSLAPTTREARHKLREVVSENDRLYPEDA